MRRWGLLHAASLVLGMATVLGATLSAVMYLLHHQKLRGQMRWLRRLQLPSLEQLTAVNRWMVILSVPCLTVGLVTGFILLLLDRQTAGTARIRWTDPTIITTIVVWMAMVALLVRLLVIRRQSGKAVAQMSLLSGGFLLITIIGPMLLSRTGAISTFHGGRDGAASRSPGVAEETPQP
jgi:ABC-type transport system involved in cytochrome c biogenesis permease subunit